MNSDHIVVLMWPLEALKCLHCGQEMQTTMPSHPSLSSDEKAFRRKWRRSVERIFREDHLKCQPAPSQKQAA